MPNLTIKNLPNDLYLRLKEAAERGRRSLNSEVLHRLEQSVGSEPLDVDDLLAEVRAVRERNRVPYLTEDALRAARDGGRA